MTSKEFVIWFRGFTEACNDYTATPKQWDRIKEVLEEVEDYDDNPGIDVKIDDWKPERDTFREPSYPPYTPPMGPYNPPYWVGDPPGWLSPYTTSGITIISGSGSITTSGSCNTFTTTDGTTSTTVWNDKMGNWHYTNYPEGFGYYTNSTLGKTIPEDTKKQLLD